MVVPAIKGEWPDRQSETGAPFFLAVRSPTGNLWRPSGRLAPLAAEPWLTVHTPRQPEFAGALATVACAGLPPTQLAAWLWERHRTLVRPILHPEFQGIRVTPNLSTTPADLERFVALLKAAATKGLG